MTENAIVATNPCGCRFSDAWRCAFATALTDRIACPCECHKYIQKQLKPMPPKGVVTVNDLPEKWLKEGALPSEAGWFDSKKAAAQELRAALTPAFPPPPKGVLYVEAVGKEVVINHPDIDPDKDGNGHIVFSPDEARALAELLTEKANEIERSVKK